VTTKRPHKDKAVNWVASNQEILAYFSIFWHIKPPISILSYEQFDEPFVGICMLDRTYNWRRGLDLNQGLCPEGGNVLGLYTNAASDIPLR
jgi:hypothetical protein